MSSVSGPWYKNPWVWLVIALPMSAVVGGIITIFITNANQPDMVVDEYYKKGKAINLELSLYRKTKELGLEFTVKFEDNRVVITPNKQHPALKVELVHSTLAAKDFDLVATPNANGQLTATFEQELTGKWQMFIAPMDSSWKTKTELALPNPTEILVQ